MPDEVSSSKGGVIDCDVPGTGRGAEVEARGCPGIRNVNGDIVKVEEVGARG